MNRYVRYEFRLVVAGYGAHVILDVLEFLKCDSCLIFLLLNIVGKGNVVMQFMNFFNCQLL